jgi:hypothetical protein
MVWGSETKRPAGVATGPTLPTAGDAADRLRLAAIEGRGNTRRRRSCGDDVGVVVTTVLEEAIELGR